MKTYRVLFALLAVSIILLITCGITTAQEKKDATFTTDNPDPKERIAVEKLPEMVNAANPVYPDEAKKNNISGKAYVKVLVNKEGKPIKAFVIKSDSELFIKPAVDAAMQSQFTPAFNKGLPISVWIVLPYRFETENQVQDYSEAGPQTFDTVELAKTNMNGLIEMALKKANTEGWRYDKIGGNISFGDESALYRVIQKDKTWYGFITRDGVNIYKYRADSLEEIFKFVNYLKNKKK